MRFFSFSKPQTNVLGKDVHAEGSLKVPGDLEILGEITGGRIEAKGHINLHEKAVVSGTMKAKTVCIERGARWNGPVAIGSVPSEMMRRMGPALGFTK